MSVMLSITLTSYNIRDVVDEFHKLHDRDSEKMFISNYQQSKEPSILAYVCAIEMKQAEYGYNPILKLKIFYDVKKRLEKLVEKNPNDIHLRYVRLVLQERTPSILGYKDHIDEDKVFLNNKLNTVDKSDYLDAYIYTNTSL